MSVEKFVDTVAEAFKIGNKDPYSDIREHLKEGGRDLWLNSLEEQRDGKVKDRYAQKHRKPPMSIETPKHKG